MITSTSSRPALTPVWLPRLVSFPLAISPTGARMISTETSLNPFSPRFLSLHKKYNVTAHVFANSLCARSVLPVRFGHPKMLRDLPWAMDVSGLCHSTRTLFRLSGMSLTSFPYTAVCHLLQKSCPAKANQSLLCVPPWHVYTYKVLSIVLMHEYFIGYGYSYSFPYYYFVIKPCNLLFTGSPLLHDREHLTNGD